MKEMLGLGNQNTGDNVSHTLHRASLLSWFVDFSAMIGTKVSNENVGFPSLHAVFSCNHKDFAMMHAYLFTTNLCNEEDD